MRSHAVSFAVLTAVVSPIAAQSGVIPKSVDAKVWRTAQRQIESFRYDKLSLRVQLFANSNQIQDPTAICFDDRNRLYVTESHRWRRGVDDNRQRQFWFLDDVSSQTVADRLKMYEKWHSKYPAKYYTEYSEKVILLDDTDGDGAADFRKVYAEDFKDAADGPAIGLIAKEGKVWMTCIPHLWLLEDTDDDGVADQRASLQDGFGVRVSLSGHDMHGLVWGPDGKLYWSIGDRGYNIKTKEGREFAAPASGAVFRCDPDGTDVEVFFEGLRNPQELAFDQFGNLFSVDNNADLGDKARVVYLMEGGTAGWHSGFQNLTTFRKNSGIEERDNLVPWMVEKLWETPHKGRPAYVLPPLEGFTIDGRVKVSGPSGVVFHSTDAMGAELANAFYVCDFRGRAARSGVFSFKVANAGAGYRVTEHKEFLGGVGTPDIDFSYDGKMFIADWYGSWTGNGKGNVYSVAHASGAKQPHVAETLATFRKGFRTLTAKRLRALLGHADMRVRLRAQYELARRGVLSLPVLLAAASAGESIPERLHGIWGVGQLARKNADHGAPLMALLEDGHPEVRANTLRVLGEAGFEKAVPKAIAMLRDDNARVRGFAATALGKLGAKSALEPLVAQLIENDDRDPFLRHALAHAIRSIGSREFVYGKLEHPHRAVRLGMLLVLRAWQDAKLSTLLADKDRFIVEAATRAIHDLGILAAEVQLAQRVDALTQEHTPLTHQRVLNSNFRLGRRANARALFRYCKRTDGIHERMRVEAMQLLLSWQKPHRVDRVLGLIRPYPEGREDVTDIVRAELPGFMTRAKGTAAAKAVALAAQYKVELDTEVLLGAVVNAGMTTDFRVASLRNLAAKHPDVLMSKLTGLRADPQPLVRAAALQATLSIDAATGADALLKFLRSENVEDRRAAYAQVPANASKEVRTVMVERLLQLVAGKGQPESNLELTEAAARSKDADVAAAYQRYQTHVGADLISQYLVSLRGGDVKRGRDLFQNHGIAQCVRCHRLDKRPSTGPGLRGIGKKDRAYLLRALLTPSSEIADGFATVGIETKDGKDYLGVMIKSDATSVTLKMEKETKKIAKADIAVQSTPMSAMVPMIGILSKRELRDLVEFLSSLKR